MALRVSIRRIRSDRTRFLTTVAVAVIAVGPVLGIGVLVALAVGATLGTDPPAPEAIAPTLRAGSGVGWSVLVGLVALRSGAGIAELGLPDLELLAVSPTELVLGAMLAEWLRFAAWIFVPVSIIVAAFIYAGGPLTALLVVPLTAVVILTASIPVGFVLGCTVRSALIVSPRLVSLRIPALFGLAAGYFAIVATGRFEIYLTMLVSMLGSSPAGWSGSFLLVMIPGSTLPVAHLVGAVIGALLAPITMTWIGAPIAFRLWTRHRPTTAARSHRATRSVVAAVLSPFVSVPTRMTCSVALARARRSPARAVYVVYPLLGSVFFLGEIVQRRTVPVLFVALLCIYLAWGTGVLFTLNPFGDIQAVAPLVRTAPVTGRAAIGGTALAAVVVGVPIAIIGSATLGLASPLDGSYVAGLVIGTVTATVIAPFLALGVGALFPRLEPSGASHRSELPSKLAFSSYSLLVLVPAGSAIILGVPTLTIGLSQRLVSGVGLLGVDQLAMAPHIVAASLAILLVLGGVGALVSFWYACRRFDRMDFP